MTLTVQQYAIQIYVRALITLIPPPSKGEKPFIGEKMASSLLCHALKDGILESHSTIGKNKKITYRDYLLYRERKNLPLSTHLELSTFLTYVYPEHFSWLIRNSDRQPVWNIGDNTIFISTSSQCPLFPKEAREISALSFGRYKIIYISNINGSYQTNTGGHDMINKCYHSYNLYPQSHPPIIPTKKDLIKIWPWQNIKSNMNLYEQYIETVKLYFVMNDPLFHLNQEHYVDSKLIKKFEDLFGKLHWKEMKKFGSELQKKNVPILDKRLFIKPWKMKNPTKLDDFFFYSFVNSPRTPTYDFVRHWSREYGDAQIGVQFEEKCENLHLLERFPSLQGRVLDVGLRSQVWIDLYSSGKYKTGRNSKEPVTDHHIQSNYNLVRGNFGEAIALKNLKNLSFFSDDDDVRFATPSMIIEDGEGSRAFCPDGLAVYQDEIVPIEVKTIIGSPDNNRSFRREFELARLQLWGAVRAINADKTIIATRGLGVFLFISPHDGVMGFQMCYHLYDFHPSEVRFEK